MVSRMAQRGAGRAIGQPPPEDRQACERESAVRHFGAARLGEQRAQVARGAGARAERNRALKSLKLSKAAYDSHPEATCLKLLRSA